MNDKQNKRQNTDGKRIWKTVNKYIKKSLNLIQALKNKLPRWTLVAFKNADGRVGTTDDFLYKSFIAPTPFTLLIESSNCLNESNEPLSLSTLPM